MHIYGNGRMMSWKKCQSETSVLYHHYEAPRAKLIISSHWILILSHNDYISCVTRIPVLYWASSVTILGSGTAFRSCWSMNTAILVLFRSKPTDLRIPYYKVCAINNTRSTTISIYYRKQISNEVLSSCLSLCHAGRGECSCRRECERK
jgi:hypothetical protein